MEADMIILLRDRKILERGNYDQLMAMKGEIANLIKTSLNEDQGEANSSHASESALSDEDSTVYGGSPVGEDDDEDQAEAEAAQEGAAHLAPLKPGGATARKFSSNTLRRASSASFRGPRGKIADEEGGAKTKQLKEFSEQGKVKWSVYGEYAKTSNLAAVVIYLLLLAGAQTASVGKWVTIGSSSCHLCLADANVLQAQVCGSNTGPRSTSGTAGTPTWASTLASISLLAWDPLRSLWYRR
jgi:hypothetical protein